MPGLPQFMQWAGDRANQFGKWGGDQLNTAGNILGLQGGQPTPYKFDTGPTDEDRANQQALIEMLKQRAAGQGPSLVQGQLQQATDANLKNAMAVGAAQQGQGAGYASALRNIADNQANTQQQAAGQSALLKNAEQMGAQQQLAGVVAGTRGQDMGQQGMQQQNAFGYDQMNAGINQANIQRRLNMISGIGQGIQSMVPMMGGAPGAAGAGGNALSEATMLGPSALSGSAGAGDLASLFGNAAHGALIGGRPRVPGDNSANDTVPAMLSPGEIVLPRSVTQSQDASNAAAEFVAALKAHTQRLSDGGEVRDPDEASESAEMEKKKQARENRHDSRADEVADTPNEGGGLEATAYAEGGEVGNRDSFLSAVRATKAPKPPSFAELLVSHRNLQARMAGLEKYLGAT